MRYLLALRTLALSLLFLTLDGCGVFGKGYSTHLRRAEEFAREGDFDKAIDSYRQHITERLSVQSRPEWENPYFYLIIIGDIHLEQDKVEDALKAYEEAETHGVHIGLISDRFRYVAAWYERQQKYSEAMEILKRYRNRDELLFDLMLDRIGREMVAEEVLRSSPSPSPSPN